MGVMEYKSDGSFREYRNHWTHRTKAELIRELWDAAGELEKLERENAELLKQVNRLDELKELARQSIVRIKAEAYAEAAEEIDSWCKDGNMDILISQGMGKCATWLFEEALRIKSEEVDRIKIIEELEDG